MSLAAAPISGTGLTRPPKSHRAKRAAQKRAPQLEENEKSILVLKGHNTSATIVEVLGEIRKLTKPLSKGFQRKNEILPFEGSGESKIEFLCTKNDCAMFALGSHTKKRPHNLVVGRLYDGHILDMFEFGVEDFIESTAFKGVIKSATGAKNALMFAGEGFEQSDDLRRFKSLLVDMFRGPIITQINVTGLDHLIAFVAVDGKIHMRCYAWPQGGTAAGQKAIEKAMMAEIEFKKNEMEKNAFKQSLSKRQKKESDNSDVEKISIKRPTAASLSVDECGPAVTLTMRRTHLASDDLWRVAMKKPRGIKPKKEKNVQKDALGHKVGRIRLNVQKISSLQTRKLKGLKKYLDSNGDEIEAPVEDTSNDNGIDDMSE